VAQTEGRAGANVQVRTQAQQGQKRRQIPGETECADDAMQGEFLVVSIRAAWLASVTERRRYGTWILPKPRFPVSCTT